MSTNSERTSAYEWGFEKGKQAELERIIKLLDGNHTWAFQHDPASQDSCASCESIALIKGENK